MPIKLEDKVKAQIVGSTVNFEGPKGKISIKLPNADIKVTIKDNVMTVARPSESRQHKSLHGLTRSILGNAAHGVAKGWEKQLAIRGVGFRAEVKGKQLHFALGFSHPIVFDLPEGVTAEVGKVPRTEESLPTLDLTLKSVNRELLGLTAVTIRSLRPPEPYKGKGVKYVGEQIRRKAGKAGGK
jgi:large subunit ribosomal protein L6